MSLSKIEILERALNREKKARKQAENILEKKSFELYNTSKELKVVNEKLEYLLSQKISQLKGVFENINDAYVVIDTGGNVIDMNDIAVDMFGYDIKENPLNVTNLIFKEDYEYAMDSFRQLLTNGKFSNYNARIVTKNSDIKWVDINASVVYDDNNNPIAAQGVVRDVTEDKKKNNLIEVQRKQLEAIVDNTTFGIVLIKDGKILQSNASMQKMFGYSNEEFIDFKLEDISLKDNYKDSQLLMEKINNNELDRFEITKRYRKKNKEAFWAKTTVSAVRDEQGKLKYQIAILEDETKKRQERLIIETINNIAKSILGKDDIQEISTLLLDKISKYLNSPDCKIFIINKHDNTVERIENDSNSDDNKVSILKQNSLIYELIQTKKSKIIFSDINEKTKEKISKIAVPIISNETVLGVIYTSNKGENYFTKKQLDTLENIANLISLQLKGAINLRERKIVETRNKELLVKLERSNAELNEYAHVVSHDLKSPLRSIAALTSWIKTDNLEKFDEASIQNFDDIDITLETMDNLISNILEFSSLDRTLDNKKENVDLNDVVDELTKVLFVPDTISIEVLNPLPTIKGDRTKLQQLFQNLIGNSIKYNDKENGYVKIDVKEQPSYYEFSIKDNGIGIEKKHFNKIFKIFQALKKSKNSSGIGLSIVKKIVDMYGGEVWLESELNKGTTFYFTLKK